MNTPTRPQCNPGDADITLGTSRATMMHPPNEGTVFDGEVFWKIGRNGSGAIVLRHAGTCHPDFLNGMYLSEFVHWINSHW